jgi:hypothetical protein
VNTYLVASQGQKSLKPIHKDLSLVEVYARKAQDV